MACPQSPLQDVGDQHHMVCPAMAQQALEDAFDNVVVLGPRSPYPEDDLIMPGEFDIA